MSAHAAVSPAPSLAERFAFWWLLLVVVQQAQRVFLIGAAALRDAPSPTVLGLTLVTGLRADLVTASFGMLVALAVALVVAAPVALRGRPRARAALVRTLGVAAAVLSVAYVAVLTIDMGYYLYSGQRLDAVFMEYVTDLLGQGRHSGYAFASQLPIWPERRLLKDGAYQVGQLLEKWSAPGWPDPETEQVYSRAMRIPSVAHSALEYHRWLARSGVRPDGLRYARYMRTPIVAPVLHLHGAMDSCVLPQTARGAGRYVEGPYRWRVIDGAGHFPHEERPEVLDTELLGWLADPEPER